MNKFNLSLKLLLCIFVRVTGSSIPPRKYVRVSTVSLAPNRQILISIENVILDGYFYYESIFRSIVFSLCQVFNLFHVMP